MTLDIAQAIREARGGLDWIGVEAKSSSSKSASSPSSRGQVSVPIARITFPESYILDNVKQFTKEVLDICNGVGTQAEVGKIAKGKGTGKKKAATIEKMYLTTSQGLSVNVTDVQSLLG